MAADAPGLTLALVFVGRWLNATKIGGQQPAEPFASNFYYVGAAFLITGPEGHIVLDAGYPTNQRHERAGDPGRTALRALDVPKDYRFWNRFRT